METKRALVILRTRDGLRAFCSCGAALGESVSWDSSVAVHREHDDAAHQPSEPESDN